MRPLLTRAASRDVDRHATEEIGVPGIVLMENAGRGAFEVIRARHGDQLRRVVLVGGPGQNGGDAWVIARHLSRLGVRSVAALVIPRGESGQLGGDARPNWDALAHLPVERLVVDPESEADRDALGAAIHEASLVVDGLFGTGLTRDIAGGFAEIVQRLNASPVDVVALDLPSGVDADTGRVLGCAVRARSTVTFAEMKRGLLQEPGRELAGEAQVADIGVPSRPSRDAVIEAEDLRRLVPPRARAAHKGTGGHVLVVGGDAGKTGAALLAGTGALRAGAGLVTLVAPPGGRAVLEHKVRELMTAELPERREERERLFEDRGALVVGPGLGFSQLARDVVSEVATSYPGPVILDADALSLLVDGWEELAKASGPRILTPHPGEAARLLGCEPADVQADRYAAAEQLADRSGQIVVLKGAGTIIASVADGIRVCDRGTPAMGVAGTGDVLSGVLGALFAARDLGASPFDRATAGVLWHALAGEKSALADRGLRASELADALPRVLADQRAGAEMSTSMPS